MGRYAYQVKDATGRAETGVLAAADINEASRMLRRDGRAIVGLSEETASQQAAAAPTSIKKVRREDVIYFSTQLAVMVDTGVPLSDALASIAEQTDHTGLKAMVKDISDQVQGGVEFSKALEKYPKCFSRLYVAMMRASEASGTMGMMLQRVCDYMVDERETLKRVKAALIYPMCMLSFCAIVVTALLVFVLPKFEKIYSAKGSALPKPTAILLGVSNGLRDHWMIVVGVLIASVVGIVMFVRTESGRLFMDSARLKIPLLGSMYRKAYLARSLRTMATMITTGVTMLDGLQITADVAGNSVYSNIWKGLAERIKEGSSMSEELAKCRIVPPSVTQMISAGERSGRLGQVMNRISQFCEDDLKIAVKTITTMIEPLMIIIMGLLIGGIAIALLLPVFSISKVVAK